MPKSGRTNEAKWFEDYQYWKIQVQRDGDRQPFYSSIPGKKGKVECEKKADKWLEDNCPQEMKFRVAWEKYLAVVKDTTGSGNYVNVEKYGRLYILPEMGHKKLSKVTVDDMDTCIRERVANNGLSKRTCTNVRSAFVGFYRFCKKKNWPLVEPENLTIPTTAPVGERIILQPAEVVTVFTKETRKRYGKDVFFFFIHAIRFVVVMGDRRGEVCGFQKSDLLHNGSAIAVKRAINNLDEETKGKNDNARRWSVLPKLAVKILADQEQMLNRLGIISPWLFPDENGDRLDSNHLYKMWKAFARTYGITCSLHELRHTFISIVKSIMPEGLLKPIVGHSKDMDTFGTYGHEFGDDMQLAADYIDTAYTRILEAK